jgi:dihydrofolate reductase
MRKLIVYIATSLDGYIARRDGSIDWLFEAEDYGYPGFLETVDTLLLGRHTYEQLLGFEPYPYSGKTVYVFSRARAGEQDAHATFVAPDPAAFLEALRTQPGKDIWLVGGAGLVADFQRAGLVDVWRIFVHPILLGAGIPLFAPDAPEQTLVLTGTCPYPDGLVELRYERRERDAHSNP